jgi:uncharacterized metal-binding protein
MPELPKKKVGIVACSGEELAEGTVTRLAALSVLEQLRPGDTVTICLPLFLAGGEGDRAFARFYPTIAIDGCDKRCAARATEMYSNKPAAEVVVAELVAQRGLDKPAGLRRLDEAGWHAVEAVSEHVAGLVDSLLARPWSRRQGTTLENPAEPLASPSPTQASCSCGSGIPVAMVNIRGEEIPVAGLPLIFQQLHQAGRAPDREVIEELMSTVKIYSPIPAEAEGEYAEAFLQAYELFCRKQDGVR